MLWPYINYHKLFFLKVFDVMSVSKKPAYLTIQFQYKKEPSLLPVLITELHCLPESQNKTNPF